ncbi:hypothetical protein DRQ36_06810 [bacterium]|nr:MAG: hypothetical protein DRQ36_06810 [bacterium]
MQICLILVFSISVFAGDIVSIDPVGCTSSAGRLFWSDDGATLLATSRSGDGLWLVDIISGEIKEIELEGVRGKNAFVSHGRVSAKTITPEGQRPVIYNIETGEAIYLAEPSPSAGTAIIVGDYYACTVDENLLIFDIDLELVDRVFIPGIPHRIRPFGNSILWSDANGRVFSFEIETGSIESYPLPIPLWNPVCSDSTIYAESSNSGVYMYSDGYWFPLGEGLSPVPVRNGIIVTRAVTEGKTLVSSELYLLNDNSERKITGTSLLIGYPAISQSAEKIAFVDLSTGDIHIADFNGTQIFGDRVIVPGSSFNIEIPERPRPAEPMVNLYCPYIHQIYDTPDWFPGNWSCGPTSCMMAQKKYSILPNHDITCSSPYSHTSTHGWYIPNLYSFNGYTYDGWGECPSPVDSCQGAHGFISPTGGAWWDLMRQWLEQTLIPSGIDYDPTWTDLIAEIDAGYIIVTSSTFLGSYGHITVIKGYNPDHSYISNDPYGNANTSPWLGYDGADVTYDWMGYDNGHHDPEVRGFIYVHRSGSEADTIVDDLSSGFVKYGDPVFWHGADIGFDSHMWWTYSTNATDTTDDTCYTTWTPVLPDRRNYEVFTFIPNSNAVASAKYRVYHDRGVTETVIRQADYFDEWVSLGTFSCEAGQGSRVYLGDGTGVSGERIGFDAIWWSDRGALPSPDTLVSLFSDGFRWGGPIKWRRIVSGGTEGTYYWTASISSPDVNSGIWVPGLPADGDYDIYTFIPSGESEAEVEYRIGHSAGETVISIDQSAYSDEWAHLGRFNFTVSGSSFVYLGDSTGSSGNHIAYDAVVWRSEPMAIAETEKPAELGFHVFPNPFNSSVTISIYRSESAEPLTTTISGRGVGATERSQGQVEIAIYDINGRLVADLPFTRTESGENLAYGEDRDTDSVREPTPLIWRPDKSMPSGTYLIKLKIGDYILLKRIVYLK